MLDPFVSRNFRFDGDEVECRFFTPEPDRSDYRCRYEIDIPNKPVAGHAYGVDQIQALLLAMQKAHVDLLLLRDKSGRRVEWLGQENLNLPLNDGLRDLTSENDL
ncbi:MAG: hypothetical protein ABJ251_04550 [Paracoccaceae bacterium]